MTYYFGVLAIVSVVCLIAKLWVDMQKRDELKRISELLQKK